MRYDHAMQPPRFIPEAEFSQIVRNTPLVSIDLVIKDPAGAVLLGLRVNEPARGTYFVPGGIIRKNETISDAFARIVLAETGLDKRLEDARFLGVYEHFYATNRFLDPSFSTHYVVLAHELTLSEWPQIATDDQHSAMLDDACRNSRRRECAREYAGVFSVR
jgi:colanic acid biosynthesis protein WcaH